MRPRDQYDFLTTTLIEIIEIEATDMIRARVSFLPPSIWKRRPANFSTMSKIEIDWDKIATPEPVLTRFSSRRSVVYSTKGIVAASQPLAVEAGLEILRKGGNAGWCFWFIKIVPSSYYVFRTKPTQRSRKLIN
jgi:hypothetical protein